MVVCDTLTFTWFMNETYELARTVMDVVEQMFFVTMRFWNIDSTKQKEILFAFKSLENK